MTVTEPVTLLTDGILAIVVGTFGLRLVWYGSQSRTNTVRLWGTSLIASALAAGFGGLWHGFHETIGETAASVLWKSTMLCVGLASVTLVAAGLHAVHGSRRNLRLVTTLLLFALASYGALVTLFSDDFRWAIFFYAPAMLIVATLMIGRYRDRPAASRLILGGIALSFLAAAIQQSGIVLHRHFNANDLYHVVQLVAFWLLYRGGMELR